MKPTTYGLASMALILSLARAAAAQTPAPAADDAAYKAAHERFVVGARLLREGKREHNASKLERAYLEFRQANSIYPRSKAALLDLVESELATDRMLDAMKHLREFVRLHGPPDAGEYKTNFQQQWDIAFKGTGHVHVVAPPNARIVLDGTQEAGVAPLSDPVDVPPGHHHVQALGIAEPLDIDVEADAGVLVDAVLAPRAVATVQPPVAPPPTASSGTRMTSAPAADEGDASRSGAAFWRPTRTWGVVVAGAGLVSLGVGALFAVAANGDANRASAIAAQIGPSGCSGTTPSSDCQSRDSAYDDQSRDHMLNLVFMGVGAAAVATGAALFFWPQPSRGSTATATPVLVPMLSPRSAGIQLRGEL